MNVQELAHPSLGTVYAAQVATAMDNVYEALIEKGWNSVAANEAVISYFKGGVE